MTQLPARISAVQKGRLQNRMPCKIPLDSICENFAGRLPLQVLIPANVVGVGGPYFFHPGCEGLSMEVSIICTNPNITVGMAATEI